MVWIKYLHVTTVAATITGFALRGGCMWWRPELLDRRWVRRLPHVNDTLLLASGLWLAFAYYGSPLQQPWIEAKLAALLVYIVLGAVALRYGSSRSIRLAAFGGALAAVGYIVSVAVTKSPLPWS